MILLVGGEKGGTGKTTLATNLAAMRARVSDVLLVDTNMPQASANLWQATRADSDRVPKVAVVQKSGRALAKELTDLATRYRDVIVDAGGGDSAELRGSMLAAAMMVIPIQASQFDLWTLERMHELVSLAQPYNPRLRARVVISRAPTHPLMSEVAAATELIGAYASLNLSRVTIRERVVYRRAAAAGLAVVEYEPRDEKAISELESLYLELYDEASIIQQAA